LKGEYEGSLRAIYLSGSPDSESSDGESSGGESSGGAAAADNEPGDPEAEPGGADEPRTAAEETDAAEEPSAAVEDETDAPEKPDSHEDETGEDDDGAASGMAVPETEDARSTAESEPVETETAESETTEPEPPEPDADPAASRSKAVGMPPPTGAPAEGRASSDAAAAIQGRKGRRKGLLLPDLRGLMAAVVAGGVLIALVWISVAWFLDTPDEEAPELTVPAVDTTEAVPEPTPEPISLPDTFEVRVIARDEPLDPIRGRVDNDLRRPYWVELGDTLLFRVADTVVLEREVGNALLIIETFLPPVDWLESDGTYTISRSRTQRWLDSLVAAGIFPPVAPDSLDIPGLEELRAGADPQ
ncbi:MAG: hypothetical protein HKN17_10085, partial [Rhodothermales bacterium]|nr:hypothetical protein [Rhodothermales bacterium]